MKIPFSYWFKLWVFLIFLMNISGLVTKSLFSNSDVLCFISKLTIFYLLCIWPFHPRFSFNERLSIVKKNRGQRIRQTNYFWWCKDNTLFLSFLPCLLCKGCAGTASTLLLPIDAFLICLPDFGFNGFGGVVLRRRLVLAYSPKFRKNVCRAEIIIIII